jgi:hypothetical protein
MGSSDSAPDINRLPVQAGTLAEGMAALHKRWDSIPFLALLFGKFWRSIPLEEQTRVFQGDNFVKKQDSVLR